MDRGLQKFHEMERLLRYLPVRQDRNRGSCQCGIAGKKWDGASRFRAEFSGTELLEQL